MLIIRKSGIATSYISALLVIGMKESSQHPSSPAWVRYCTHRDGSEQDRTAISETVDRMFKIIDRISDPEIIVRDLSIGIHVGPYYCTSWMRETPFYRWSRDKMLRRVALDSIPLPSSVADASRGAAV